MKTMMRATAGKLVLGLGLIGLACSPDTTRDPIDPGPEGGAVATGGRRATGGAVPSTGGAPPATGGAVATGGAQPSTGGAPATGGAGGGQGGSGGTGGSSSPDAGGNSGGGVADARPASNESGPLPEAGPTAPGQGPTALGRIVYSQDFESGMAGITRSPTNLPAERAVIVDDPLGQRGKVMRVIWQMGDNYRTSSGTEPRSWISNASGYQIAVGTKVSLSWGMQWTTANMDAFFAQTIGPGPVWELRVRGNGRFQILCNKCGGNTPDFFPIQTNRWYDFRVDMDWVNGGRVQFFVDGQMIHQATMSGATANCHWDGGIYNTPGGTQMNTTRTVYVSNLSVGVRP